jgi:hypothetical protein
MVEMVPVSSSAVKAVGYDEHKRELHVQFASGARYVYEGVPPEKHQALRDAASIGKFVNAHVKGAHSHRRH